MSMIVSAAAGFRGSGFRTVVGPITNTADVDRSGWTQVSKFLPAALAANGSKIRLTLQGCVAPGHVGTISAVWIGLASSAVGAKAYDFAGAQVQVTFGGLGAVSYGFGTRITSDEINFVIDRTRPVLIAYNLAAATFISYVVGLSSDYVSYGKAAINEAAVAAKAAGYTAVGGASVILANLEIM
jgi:hypothetical protein